MRLVFLPKAWTILLCFPVWLLLHLGTALLCLRLPDRFFSPDSRLYRSRRFERDGQLYERLFLVRRWKHLLPDGGRAWGKRGFRKRSLDSFSEEALTRYLIESARGELTHWLAIGLFWVFGFFTPPEVLWLMLAYALLVNLPCIIAQRYNRPRIQRLLRLRKQMAH